MSGDAVAERDQTEAVSLIESTEKLPQGGLGLIELLAGHRSRNVENHGDVAGLYGAVRIPGR